MAMASRLLAHRFNRPGHEIITHRIVALCSDGDLMEGVASEAASLAGFHRLGNLVAFYDDNRITIEGSTDLAFGEDVAGRFRAYGWKVLRVEEGNTDLPALSRAIEEAFAERERPTLVIVRTHIAFGSPHKQDTAEAHGSPLGEAEVALTKEALGWPKEPRSSCRRTFSPTSGNQSRGEKDSSASGVCGWRNTRAPSRTSRWNGSG
jgi:transketolase